MARAGKALNRWAGIAALAIAAGVPLVAPEAQRRGLPEIWDIAMGAHVDTLPVVEFVDQPLRHRCCVLEETGAHEYLVVGSDIVTQPTPEMRRAMYRAEVGNDSFG